MIVIFNGPPGTGKDEACLFFQSKQFIHLSFKEELFKATFEYFGVTKDWFMKDYDNRSIKDKPVPELKVNDVKMSRRDAMIYVSEQYIKPKYGNDYFGMQAAKQIELNLNYCFSDGGFIDELVPIINKIGTNNICIVQLTRNGCDFSSDSRRYFDGEMIEEYIINDKTEISNLHILPNKFPIRTYRIHNNGNIGEFKKALQKIYEKEKDVQQGAATTEKENIS